MEENRQKINEIKKELKSTDKSNALKAIEQIKEDKLEILIPDLIELFVDTEDTDILEKLNKIFEKTKSDKFVKNIEYAFENMEDTYSDKLSWLVASCWKNGLDYSGIPEKFIQIFIKHDYEIAFEALTVIDSSMDYLNKEKIEPLIDQLKTNIQNFSEKKEILTRELISILENKANQI